jgi:hypothetical protein
MSNAVRAIEELAHATLVRLVREGAWPADLIDDEAGAAALRERVLG